MTQVDDSTPASGRDLRQIVSYSLASGLCPLIPIPILDDWARDLLRHQLVTQLVAQSGTPLDTHGCKVLACGYHPTTASGCALGCLRTMVIKPVVFFATVILRKLVRKILFFLTIKDTVDTFSQTFHETYLVRHALQIGAITPSDPASATPAGADAATGPTVDPQLLATRQAIEEVYRTADTGTVSALARSLFKTSRRGIALAVRHMTQLLRQRGRTADQQLSDRLENEGEVHLGELIDDLTEDLESRASYLRQLEIRLEQRLAAATVVVTAESPTTGP